ncbi:copper chaperone PCu(A)C [Rhodoplanes sp. TEM]|uniref:Copper chaperone PCu(A)C n=1 Tax=Rhodoplanes tepidamans TaxID=200616 RepID=A0ABT5JCS3_RHOTP|nr:MULTISPECIES: copper chaperone PCu(A)C [Rhodoplanes]MDC7787161.1 copper chaperone PCu(A)C [Rhodoplanes tepidamans]MDC7984275.1 copper chaperone PCu(A)C [Rhodoplanes sp. TEM]MDQ0356072.1 copper(I)-binding protein [Rhodoplanes tepidamans]
MRPLVTLLAVVLAVLALSGPPAAAQTYRTGAIEIENPWARATPAGATVTAGYMRITNTGAVPDRLLAIRSAAAGSVDLQELSLDDNVMRLRTLARGLAIAPGQTIELRPGFPWQAVFASLVSQLRPGDRVPATLVFEQAGSVEVDLAVHPIGTGLRRASAAGG